jgi:hypothetical protein
VALDFSYLRFACSHVRTVALLPITAGAGLASFVGMMQRLNQRQQA